MVEIGLAGHVWLQSGAMRGQSGMTSPAYIRVEGRGPEVAILVSFPDWDLCLLYIVLHSRILPVAIASVEPDGSLDPG